MRPVKTFHVRPLLPVRLRALDDLAYNLRWSWDHETISLFRRLDPELWESTQHNPVLMLGSISQERLRELEQDESFLAQLDRVANDLRDYVGGTGARGYFQLRLNVYDRAGEPCLACATPIKAIRQGQRATYYCPRCQH